MACSEHVPVEPWRDACEGSEGPREVALVTESREACHIGRGDATLQKLPGGVNTYVGKVLMGRDTPCAQKAPQKCRFADTRACTESVQEDVFPKVLLKVSAGPLYFLATSHVPFWTHACVAIHGHAERDSRKVPFCADFPRHTPWQ